MEREGDRRRWRDRERESILGPSGPLAINYRAVRLSWPMRVISFFGKSRCRSRAGLENHGAWMQNSRKAESLFLYFTIKYLQSHIYDKIYKMTYFYLIWFASISKLIISAFLRRSLAIHLQEASGIQKIRIRRLNDKEVQTSKNLSRETGIRKTEIDRFKKEPGFPALFRQC